MDVVILCVLETGFRRFPPDVHTTPFLFLVGYLLVTTIDPEIDLDPLVTGREF